MAGDTLEQLLQGHPRVLGDFLRRSTEVWVIGCQRSGAIVYVNDAAAGPLRALLGTSVSSVMTETSVIPRLAPGERCPWEGTIRPVGGPAWRAAGSWFGLEQELVLIADRVERIAGDVPTPRTNGSPPSGRLQAMTDNMEATNRRLHEQNAKLVAANRSMAKLATTDSLTGLHNRRAFDEEAARLEIAVRSSGEALSIMVCDLDHFKLINDEHGHAAGDAVLKAFGRLICTHARADDLAIRWGGEEFLLMLPGADLEQVYRRAENIRDVLAKTPLTARKLPVTVSIGVGQMAPYESLGHLIHRVDTALYEAKQQGRNRVVRSQSRTQVVAHST